MDTWPSGIGCLEYSVLDSTNAEGKRIAFKNRGVSMNERLASNLSGYILAIISGFTSCISHAGGPPAAIYLLSKNISKTEFQATTILIFWLINIFKLFPFIYFGFVSRDTLTFSFWLVPIAFLGTWIGVKLHFILSEKLFFAKKFIRT